MPERHALLYRPITAGDLDEAIALWSRTEGIGLSAADDKVELGRFIERNVGLCWCAVSEALLVGTVLCGCDGRRGYLYHVAVAADVQGKGSGRRLVEHALDGLRAAGIGRCHAMVFAGNARGRGFWERIGWRIRDDLVTFSADLA